ncbi:hypothetical protein [Metabacillus niabensis]|uniref:hypothetical protein n=1 Tax=Metabacillus niabensis TaxID=324854 RepID=UPI001CFAA0C3|nr:hypothetical protein [Metabacillus niabensis]
MGIPTVWIIIISILSILIHYAILETAVRRGIDSSETNELLKKILENQKDKNNK